MMGLHPLQAALRLQFLLNYYHLWQADKSFGVESSQLVQIGLVRFHIAAAAAEALVAELAGQTEDWTGYVFLSSAAAQSASGKVKWRWFETHPTFGLLPVTWKSSAIHPRTVSADPGLTQDAKIAVMQIVVLEVIFVADAVSVEVEIDFQRSDVG